MTSGDSLLEAMRADAPVHQSQNAATVEEWMALASDRPAWMLWGKAQPLSGRFRELCSQLSFFDQLG